MMNGGQKNHSSIVKHFVTPKGILKYPFNSGETHIYGAKTYLLFENAKLAACITRCQDADDRGMLKKLSGFFVMCLHNSFLPN